jgi:hypothetical protein
MKPHEEHQPLVDEVHRKIGRNLMLLQHVEGMFKTLLILSRVGGASPDEIARFRSRRKEMIERHTLGELAGKFTSEILVKRGDDSSKIEPELPVGHFTFNYTVQANHDYVTQRTESLRVIVDERNELVHHFLAKWDRLSLQSTQTASAYLDQQNVRVANEANTLKNHLESLRHLSGLHHSAMASPEYEKQMEMMWLQGSQIVLLLVGLSRAAVDTDGWVGLDESGQLLWMRAKQDMASLKAMYGYNKLKPLLMASEVFDVREDFSTRGGVRVLFKLKPEAQALYD